MATCIFLDSSFLFCFFFLPAVVKIFLCSLVLQPAAHTITHDFSVPAKLSTKNLANFLHVVFKH